MLNSIKSYEYIKDKVINSYIYRLNELTSLSL